MLQKKWQKNKEEQPLPSQEGILANHMVLNVWKMNTPTQSQEPASSTSALRRPSLNCASVSPSSSSRSLPLVQVPFEAVGAISSQWKSSTTEQFGTSWKTDNDRLHRYVTQQRREIHTACCTTPHTTAKTCSPTDVSLTIFKPGHCRTSGSSSPFGTPLTPSLLLPKQSSPVANDGDLPKYAKSPFGPALETKPRPTDFRS